MNTSYSFQTHTKCIIAGEHSVLRGGAAVVVPLKKYGIHSVFIPDKIPLCIRFKESSVFKRTSFESGKNTSYLSEADKEMFEILFSGVFDMALKELNLKQEQIKGVLEVESFIPLGVGLGGSASICSLVSLFFNYLEFIDKKDVLKFAKKLEAPFHGQSSGVDIAGALAHSPILFQTDCKDDIKQTPIQFRWKPHLYLSDSLKKSVTEVAVNQVKQWQKKNESRAYELDIKMNSAVEMTVRALEGAHEVKNFDLLSQAIVSAAEVFCEWGLVPQFLQDHMSGLKGKGAVAVKPTGAGLGGGVLSLWEDVPPCDLDLIPIKF